MSLCIQFSLAEIVRCLASCISGELSDVQIRQTHIDPIFLLLGTTRASAPHVRP